MRKQDFKEYKKEKLTFKEKSNNKIISGIRGLLTNML